MWDVVWDLKQQHDIYEAKADASSASARASDANVRTQEVRQDVLELEARLQRLSLLCQAMWELLSERGQITNNDLIRRVLEVDGRDGSTDGKIGSRIVDCPRCKNKVNSRHPRCVVCGGVIATKHPFEV